MSASAMMVPSLTFGGWVLKWRPSIASSKKLSLPMILMAVHKWLTSQASCKPWTGSQTQFGLTISLGKTEVLFQRAPNSVAPQPALYIYDAELKVADNFKYLGSVISNDGSLDNEIASRINKANQALGRLRYRLLNHHNVTLDTKLKVYRAVVLSSLLYDCEAWTVYRQHLCGRVGGSGVCRWVGWLVARRYHHVCSAER